MDFLRAPLFFDLSQFELLFGISLALSRTLSRARLYSFLCFKFLSLSYFCDIEWVVGTEAIYGPGHLRLTDD
jgi:hypothetical protein